MTANTNLSAVPDEKRDATSDHTIDMKELADEKKKKDDLQGFVKISVRGTLFTLARTTICRSPFLWRLINDEPNSKDGSYHIDRNPKNFEHLMDYLVNNSIPDNLTCSVRDFYNEALFYGIDLPENDCWGTTLSYKLNYINTYDIRSQFKSFADKHGVFGWAQWKQRVTLDIEFHCHRKIDLNLVEEYMIDQETKQIFLIRSQNKRDQRSPRAAQFRCPRTRKEDQSSKSPPQTPSSTPSSSESCPESAKDLLKQLSSADVKTWIQQTMFHHLAETWFTYNVNGKELLEISKTGHLTNGRFILSGYDLIRFKDILNRFGFELELE